MDIFKSNNYINLYMRIGQRILLVCVVCLVSTLFIGPAYADFFKTMGVYHKYNPQVCIMLPEEKPEEISAITNTAIGEWERKLLEKTGGNWNFFVFEYEFEEHDKLTVDDYPSCTVFINYTYSSEDSSVGRTGYDFSSSVRYYYWIEVDTHAEEKVIQITLGDNMNTTTVGSSISTKPLTDSDIYNIVLHEFGHGLGVEHYYINTNCIQEECDYTPIMYHQIDVFQETTKPVTEKDINMIIRIYGEDGFGLKQPQYIPRVCEIVNQDYC